MKPNKFLFRTILTTFFTGLFFSTSAFSADIIWIDDSLPANAKTTGVWNFISAMPTPFSGKLAHDSTSATGTHQHLFIGTTKPLKPGPGDILYTYVYLDPQDPPGEVMLQWFDGSDWGHRAYWGADMIQWGTNGKKSRRYMGPLPTTGTWARLEIPASDIGVNGKSISGIAFTLYDGHATWDRTGLVSTDNGNSTGTIAGFTTVSPLDWTETSVRKVLGIFAYGGQASDAQISSWAAMPPEAAITEMLSFEYTNNKLSPAEDASSLHGSSLQNLQEFWGGNSADNPMRWNKRKLYDSRVFSADGYYSALGEDNLKRTWVQAVNTRGINPFPHKIAFYLTNYQMAINIGAGRGLMRDYYDKVLTNLVAGRTFTDIISESAKAAVVARRYGSNNSRYNKTLMRYYGNDDFAREYFQLFFRLQGEAEDPDYHENITIKNNSMLLTGMQIDEKKYAYDSTSYFDWYLPPIQFSDHVDPNGNLVNNLTNHHTDCLEILHTTVCGSNAEEKIDALSPIVASNPEVLTNLPAYIISQLADDNLNDAKIAAIRIGWLAAKDNLLTFLRSYAVSVTFHDPSTVKYKSTFDRNLALYNATIVDNDEAFNGREDYDTPRLDMKIQGGDVFDPSHEVFGNQTGLEAANNPNIFKHAFEVANMPNRRLARLYLSYPGDASGTTEITWNKDWVKLAPTNLEGKYEVAGVAYWLWQRLVADGGKNFDPIARSQVLSLLATGHDFGYTVTQLAPAYSSDPLRTYTSTEIGYTPALIELLGSLKGSVVSLNSTDLNIRREANRRVNLAINFISMMPYTFAMEGK